MNKALSIIIIIIAIVVLAAVGYVAWSWSATPQTVVQSPTPTPIGDSTSNNTQPNLPTVKTDIITAPYISTVVVKGTVNPNGALTTYWYEYGTTTSLGSLTSTYSVGSGYSTLYTPAYITGLNSNTNYYFRLTAKNYIGTISGDTYSFKTNTTPPPAGTAPATTTTDATGISRTTASLQGRINPNNSDTNFWFEYGLTSELGFVTSSQSVASGSSVSGVSIPVSNLQPLTKYYFRLNAQNQFGTVNGQILNFTTAGPTAATAPTVKTNSVTTITSNSAKLNGSVNSNGTTITYWFEYSDKSSLSSASTTQEQSIASNNFSPISVFANLSSLTNNTKYYARVVAKNQYGTTRGDVVSFTTKK